MPKQHVVRLTAPSARVRGGAAPRPLPGLDPAPRAHPAGRRCRPGRARARPMSRSPRRCRWSRARWRGCATRSAGRASPWRCAAAPARGRCRPNSTPWPKRGWSLWPAPTPPEGHARWSLRLLADQAVLVEGIPPVSRELCAARSKKRAQALAGAAVGDPAAARAPPSWRPWRTCWPSTPARPIRAGRWSASTRAARRCAPTRGPRSRPPRAARRAKTRLRTGRARQPLPGLRPAPGLARRAGHRAAHRRRLRLAIRAPGRRPLPRCRRHRAGHRQPQHPRPGRLLPGLSRRRRRGVCWSASSGTTPPPTAVG